MAETAAPAPPPEVLEAWSRASDRARRRARWLLTARPSQLPPDGNWFVWLVMAGRGFGKTRLAAEDMAYFALTHPGSRLAIVAPTYGDCRDTCVEGDSGLLYVLPRSEIAVWNRSLGELVLTNGSRFKLFSADEPERLRGPQHHRAWIDELAAFNKPAALDLLLMGLRLGDQPQLVATTTPRSKSWLRDLVDRPDVVRTRGSMRENAANLSPVFLHEMEQQYAGTRLARQELEGELIEDSERALVRREWIESQRVDASSMPLVRLRAIGLDPGGEGSQAMVQVGVGLDHNLYVERSEMVRGTATDFLRHAVTVAMGAHNEYGGAPVLVVEKNHGGDYLTELLAHVMRERGAILPVKTVWASAGKRTRAEPAAMLIEQGKVKWVGGHSALEDEWCQTDWDAESPHLADAMVWAVDSLTGSATIGHEEELSAVPFE